ncbi:hypothetical protein SAMN05444401_4112 [Clostridium amylolyticum]|uniref:Uncharacterized protein n=1 Tax=Clostridium amylolyticum TaxID=1121298 RepID=A0A1M6MTL5_9CLOT|nr:DUF6762 family protein [Clostridium amylolyticum]SHJ86593.1 hypothetical protein SAMN05444401_4112 [Clostridium amylolyticum]
MDFSSLVLMEVDPKDKKFLRELGSYEVSQGAEYITKFYCDGSDIFINFQTDRDVEDWEYSAIFYVFSKEAFANNGYKIEDKDDEYNPSWIVSFPYTEDREEIQKNLDLIGEIIESSLKDAYKEILGKEEEYK